MNERSASGRLSMPGSTLDYHSQKRLEELNVITDEVLKEHGVRDCKYDYKLYRKYKQLKLINRKLQEIIISQHCPGCKCYEKPEEEEEQDSDDSISIIYPDESSTIQKNTCSFFYPYYLSQNVLMIIFSYERIQESRKSLIRRRI